MLLSSRKLVHQTTDRHCDSIAFFALYGVLNILNGLNLEVKGQKSRSWADKMCQRGACVDRRLRVQFFPVFKK